MAWTEVRDLTGPRGPAGSDADVTEHEEATDPHSQYATDDALTSGLAGKSDKPAIGIIRRDSDLQLSADTLDGLNVAMTGSFVLATPSGGRDQQIVQIVAYAEGGARDLTFDSGFERLEGIEQTYTIPSGKRLRAAVRRSEPGTLSGDTDPLFPASWIVEAVAVTQ